MAYIEFPLQISRQYAAPLDVSSVMTSAEKTTYLANPVRYAGQVVYDSTEQKLYVLNSDKDAWLEVGSQSSGLAAASGSILATLASVSGELDTKINDQISGLIDSAPGILDTLKELASAIGNDDDFANTILTKINALSTALGNANGNISNLRSETVAASSTLASAIDSEESARIADVTALSAAIQSGNSGLSAAIDQLRTETVAASGTLADNISQLRTETVAATGTLDTRITSEVSTLNTTIQSVSSTLDTRITTEVSNLVNSAPGILDTLGELAAALSGDDNFAVTVANNISNLRTDVAATTAALDSKIDTEVSALESSLASVSGALDFKIDSEVSALESTMASVSSTLDSKIDSEINTLHTHIDSKIDFLSGAVDDEVAIRVAAVLALSASVDELRTETVAASSTLDSNISTLRSETVAASGTLFSKIDTDLGALSAEMIQRDTATLTSAQSYTDSAIADLVDGAPELLNTLKELASAIGEDENFAVTLTNKFSELSTAMTSAANADDARLDVLETAFNTLTGTSGVTTLGSIASQNYNAVSITGGTVMSITLSAATLSDCTIDSGTF